MNEYTVKGKQYLNLFLKIVSKYQLAKLLDVSRTSLYRWLNWEGNISEFYYRTMKGMYELIKSSLDERKKFSLRIWIAKIKQRKEEPAYKEMKKRLSRMSEIIAERTFETNKKILKQKHSACELCGRTDCLLEVHHIITRGEAGWTALVHTIKNLIVLCKDCHVLMHSKKMIRDILVKDRKLYFLKRFNGWNNHQTDVVNN